MGDIQQIKAFIADPEDSSRGRIKAVVETEEPLRKEIKYSGEIYDDCVIFVADDLRDVLIINKAEAASGRYLSEERNIVISASQRQGKTTIILSTSAYGVWLKWAASSLPIVHEHVISEEEPTEREQEIIGMLREKLGRQPTKSENRC